MFGMGNWLSKFDHLVPLIFIVLLMVGYLFLERKYIWDAITWRILKCKVFFLGLSLNFLKSKKQEEPREEFVFKDDDPNSNLDDGIKARKILDELIEGKYEYYMYKEILPLYLGNNKKAPISKEKFKEIKDSFYNDIKVSISPVVIRRLNYVFTPAGIGIYIHSRFSTMFNKTDSKFVDRNEVLEKDNFFMNQ